MAGVSLAGQLIAKNQQKKALAGQKGVDIDALDQKARDIAARNARESAALEEALTPEVPQLRRTANRGVLSGLGSSDSEMASESALMKGLDGPGVAQVQSPLLQAAIAKAKADLELGGTLPLDVRNMVARRAGAQAGTVGGNMGLGRDIAARDLGLTSLDLSNQRLQNASTIGGQEMQMGFGNADIDFRNAGTMLSQIQMLNSINQNRFGRNLAAAGYGESIQRPTVGLDPGSVVDLTVGNTNMSNAAAANKANINGKQVNDWTKFAGSVLGQYMGKAG